MYRVKIGIRPWETPTGVAHTFRQLSQDTEYTVLVQAAKSLADGWSASGSLVTMTLRDPSIPAPAVSGVTHDTATLAWPAVSGANLYRWRQNAGAWTSTSALTVSLTSLMPLTAYTWEVQSSADAGATWSQSGYAMATTLSGDLPAAPAPYMTAIGNVSARLNWRAVPTATSYRYRYRVTGAAWTSWTTATGSQATITGLTKNTSYTAEVRATNHVGEGAAGTVSWTTTNAANAPSAPRNLAASSITATSFDVTWLPSLTGNPSRYEVKLGTGGQWRSRGAFIGVSFTGLDPGTNYTVFVRAFNGLYSTEASLVVTTVAIAAPTVSATAAAEDADRWMFTGSWGAVSGATKYRWQFWSPAQNTWGGNTHEGTGTTATRNYLWARARGGIRVSAEVNGAWGPWGGAFVDSPPNPY